MSKLSLSVVVPCRNEASNIPELYERLRKACLETVGESWELIVVDDGSTDGTWDALSKLAWQDGHVTGIKLSRNFGQQSALSAGLEYSQGERVLVIDADLQDPPELLSEMLRLMDQGADVVFGRRSVRYGESVFKRISARLFFKVLNRFSDVPVPEKSGDFRLLNRRVVDHLVALPEKHRFLRGLTSWLGFAQVPLDYERQGRKTGRSKYPVRTMVTLAVDALTSFSIRPLRMASLMGFTFGALAVLGIVYALVSWITGHVVQGWTSVIIVVLVLGSVQLFVLGIMGEYLGRLYIESKQRPLYLIDEIAGKKKDEGERLKDE